jgi:hypothetical protein
MTEPVIAHDAIKKKMSKCTNYILLFTTYKQTRLYVVVGVGVEMLEMKNEEKKE